MEDLEVVKRFLQDQHVARVPWHTVLNNTTSTRPKRRGGPVVHAISELKHFDMTAAGFATPMHRCVLRLPHSFAAFDGKEVEAIGYGQTQKEADEAACCDAMAKLLCAEPFNVVLHGNHWKMLTNALQEEVFRIIQRQVPTLEHQPLTVPPSHPLEEATIDAERKEDQSFWLVDTVVRRCLETHGGTFDPARINSRLYGLRPDEAPPWEVLAATLNKGELRGFIDQHPAFQWFANGPNGMLITWATPREPAAGADQKDQALPDQGLDLRRLDPAAFQMPPPVVKMPPAPPPPRRILKDQAPASPPPPPRPILKDQALLVQETSSFSWPALTSELVKAGWRSFFYGDGDDDRIWFWNEDTQTASWYHPGTRDVCFRRAGKYVSAPAPEAGPLPLLPEFHARIVAERMRLEQEQEQLESHVARLQQTRAFWNATAAEADAALAARDGDVPNPHNIECTLLPGGGFLLGPAPTAASLIAGEAASAAATTVPVKPLCPPPTWLKDQATITAWHQAPAVPTVASGSVCSIALSRQASVPGEP